MLDFMRNIIKPKTTPMNRIIVHWDIILSNLKILQWINNGQEIFPVLKSNAYGHWLKDISKLLNKSNVKYLCVDSFPEYQIVHKYTNKKILLIGETLLENYKYFDFKRTTFAVYNINTVKQLASFWKKIKIHLFLNTWMNREWVQENDLDAILDIVKSCKNLELEGVMSHFHSADNTDDDSYLEQVKIFKEMYSVIEKKWFIPKYRHISNSAWLFRFEDSFFNSARSWLSLYGYSPFVYTNWLTKDKNLQLKKIKPALEVYSKIISIQNLQKWDTVSYSQNYAATKKEKIATIPFGYMEWLPRSASGKIIFSCKWKYYKQVWNICMNLSCVSIDDSLDIWDDVQIIWLEWKNTIQLLSDSAGMISYEVLTQF